MFAAITNPQKKDTVFAEVEFVNGVSTNGVSFVKAPPVIDGVAMTVSRSDVGLYVVTHNLSTLDYTVIVGAVGVNSGCARLFTSQTTYFSVLATDFDGLAADDVRFGFAFSRI